MGSVRYRPDKARKYEARWYDASGRQQSKSFSGPAAARRHISALRVRHLDPLHERIRVEESVSDVNGRLIITKPKSKKSRRTVGLERAFIEQLIDGKGPDDFVFSTGSEPRRHSNWMTRHFRPARDRLVRSSKWPSNLANLTFHDLRHTCASLLIKQGIHLKSVSEWLGHSSIALTGDRYGHLYDDSTDALTAAMKELLNGKDRTAVIGLTS